MTTILQPFLWFSFFISILSLRLFIRNRIYKERSQVIMVELVNQLKYSMYEVKCENFMYGGKTQSYLFRHCNLSLTQDALIIFGYSQNILFKQLYPPIILTKNLNSYIFSDVRVINPSKINLHSFDDDIYIEFQIRGLIDTNIEIRLKGITDKSNFAFFNNSDE